MIGVRDMVTARATESPYAWRDSAAVRRQRRALIQSLFVLDLLMVVLALALAGLLRIHLDDVLPVTTLATEQHLVASILMVPVLLLLFAWSGLYDVDQVLVGSNEYARLGRAVTYGGFMALTASYAAGAPLVSRSWLPLVWILTISCVGLGRFGARRFVRRMRQRGLLRTRVVIVGASTFGVAIAQQLQAARAEGLDIVGFLDEYLPIGQPLLDGIEVIGRPEDLLRQPSRRPADEYILVQQALPYERQEEISRLMMSRQAPILRIAISSSDLLTHGLQVIERGNVPLVRLEQARLRGAEAMLKTALDRGLALLGLLLLAPFAIPTLVRAWRAGMWPFLQRHTVVGSGGEQRNLWLFAPDVTSWPPLRGLPSLVAVLLGKLSLVGPRPLVSRPGQSQATPLWLTSVKPGLTGPWRLSGPEASLEQQALQDLTYVRNYTIWEDLRILLESARRLHRKSLPGVLGRWESGAVQPRRGQAASHGRHEAEFLVESEPLVNSPV